MAFGVTVDSVSLNDIKSRVTETDILSFYLNIKELPCVINSPFREDNRPSFGIYFNNKSKRVYYKDYATNDSGGLFDLLGKLWNCNYKKVLENINKDINNIDKGNVKLNTGHTITIRSNDGHHSSSDLQCKIREWKDYDIEYWSSYGISLKWLKYADVYPISHKIIIKDGHKYVFKADKLAYAYVERKEGKVSIKIYQPKNTKGYKWSNKHDNSVVSLWTKVPEYGEQICICSSLKDALCLWANTGIPAICPQGESYRISNTAINELKRRFKKIYIIFDNDKAGILDGKKLAEATGFTNLILPKFDNGKDISDAYKILGKDEWLKMMRLLFSSSRPSNQSE